MGTRLTMEIKSPLEMLYKYEKETPDKIYLRQPVGGFYHEYSRAKTADQVRRMAAVLKDLNLEPGSKIAILSKNCAHWILSDLAIMMSGHVSVPLYPNLSEESLRQILDHSETKVLFIGKLDNFAALKKGIPENVYCISYPLYGQPEYDNWDDLIAKKEPVKENIIRDKDELATIIYTSGTTGLPKGVMHTFHNLSFVSTNAFNYLKTDTNERFFSYLPLSHIAERLLVEMGSIYTGGSVSFAESLDLFPKNLADTKPTVFLGVPRIWTKFQQGILKKMPQKKLDLFLKIPVLSGIVKKKIISGLGLDKAKHIFTGAAPTPAELIKWFAKIGINIQEAYAMTENCCYSHVTVPENIKIGYVGSPLPYCEVKLSEIDEILIKHEGLMSGYYKEPALTEEAFSDGYLKTGDKGEIDSEGFLKITGRVKDLFKTSKGKYVAPSPIELKLSGDLIEQVCLVGSGLPQPIALAVLFPNIKSAPREETEARLKSLLSKVNSELEKHEEVKKLIILKDEWTVENKVLTPSMKIKRDVLEKLYSDKYQNWYEQKGAVVWE
jgi:long-chain acyl-CoA synthetase